MEKKIYVGNLSYKADEETLKGLFARIGEVQSAKIVTDTVTGRSKGFGFVEMASDEDAEKAITSLNGTTLLDRTLTVSVAQPQDRKSRTGPRGGLREYHRGRRESGNWR